MARGKKFAMIRIGLLDHLGLLGQNPEAALVYLYCHLKAPLQGSRAGKAMIHMQTLADELGWSRHRVGRAIKWLRQNPSVESSYLVQITSGGQGHGADYYIRNFDGSAPGSLNTDGAQELIGDPSTRNAGAHRNDERMRTMRNAGAHRDDSARTARNAGAHDQTLCTRASEEQEPSITRGGSIESNPEISESSNRLILVSNEAEALERLRKLPHIESIKGERARGLALRVAMNYLPAYGIAIDPDLQESGEEPVGSQVESQSGERLPASATPVCHESPQPDCSSAGGEE